MTQNLRRLLPAGLLLLAAPLAAHPALPTPAACTVSPGSVVCDLWAKTGTVSVPGSAAAIPVWGYSDTETGAAGLPGPTLVATAGDTLTVNLHNTLGEPTTLLFAGQDQPAGGPEAAPTSGTATYVLPALRPGTYLYQAGPLVHDTADPALVRAAQHQAAMGLFGALVVRPAAAGQAYDDPATAFADEALLVLSEIDPAFAAGPATFDLRNFNPRWRLINGKAFPATDLVPAAPGTATLLRYLNAGLQHHSMALLGLDQTLVAQDGNPLSIPRRAVAETVAPGQTLDALVAVPPTAPAGARYPLYDASLMLVNTSGLGTAAGFGGMLTFLAVGTAPPPAAGPVVSNVTLTPNPSTGTAAVALGATVAAGTGSVSAAEYFLDALGAGGTGTPMALSGSTASATLPASTLSTLASGNHNVYVRALDGSGWGSATFAVLVIDGGGPVTTGLALAPWVSNGTADVALSATADDRSSGGGAIAAAELTVDGGAPQPLAVTPANQGPVASITGTIPAATLATLASGPHAVAVRSQDALGNWGLPATASLLLDRAGPTTSLVALSPNPSNGKVGVNSSTAAVRVTAALSDGESTVAGGEAFLDTPGADGSGFGLIPVDGAFNQPGENAFGDIPLSTVIQLAEGNHAVWVHGRDAAGNWGPVASATLLVDRTAPAIATLTASPSPTNTTTAPFSSNTAFTLTATGSDTATGIAGGEWFEGADPGAGNGRAMTGTGPVTATVDFTSWTAGTHTLTARVRDGAGNWSGTLSTTVDVVLPDALFANSFESGAIPWGWASATGASLSVVATPGGFPASAGAQVLRAAFGGGTAARYLTDTTPVQETSYHARFWFNPSSSLPNNTATPTLLAGLDAAGATILQVQYRRQGSAGAGFTYQVRAGALSNAGTMTSTGWVTIPSAVPSPVEIAWRAANAGAPARLQLTAGPSGSQSTVTANPATGNRRLETVRLGLAAGLGGLGAATGAVYLDAFVSTRRSTIGP
ncbi:MAG: multicopper oxidase domain-containing protein [Deltaproteobacteria bacterium]|nr:multicopper oxidase domain-containing protein [Deltaproteobacteria bacterium]